MQEAAIFNVDLKSSQNHSQQWQELKESSEGLREILQVIKNPAGKALIFSHDDPDGITSGLIIKRTLEKCGWTTCLKLPEGFMLQKEQLDNALKENPDTKAIFLMDKGTLSAYDDYATEIPVYIVDHHPSPKAPEKCVWFNPSLPAYTWCSTSILAHGIATLSETREDFDDFLSLMGIKGDWAIEPVKGIISGFVIPFFAEYGQKFKNLLSLVKERPTMFDAEQRDYTCLLSRVTEYVHATGGGGFSYFYNDRDESLRDVNHPECIAFALESISGKVKDIFSIQSLEDFVKLLDEKYVTHLEKIFKFFLEDWQSANTMLDSSAKILQLEKTGIYLFTGPKVPLLPMIGSIKLFDLKKNAGDELAQIIMVSSVAKDYTHVSVRGTGDRVHSGKFCGEMQDSLKEKYPEVAACISGGGHPKAAECTIKTDKVTFLNVLTRVTEVLSEMKAIDEDPSSHDKPRAEKLGLEYLNK